MSREQSNRSGRPRALAFPTQNDAQNQSSGVGDPLLVGAATTPRFLLSAVRRLILGTESVRRELEQWGFWDPGIVGVFLGREGQVASIFSSFPDSHFCVPFCLDCNFTLCSYLISRALLD